MPGFHDQNFLEDIISINFPALLPNIGLQSCRMTADIRQQISLTLESQLGGQLAALVNNLPTAIHGSSRPIVSSNSSFPSRPAALKQHLPLTASNSVANCNVVSHLKNISAREHRKLDRSVSEPVDRSQQIQRAGVPHSTRYKTELCRPFEESGICKYGDKCQFAHGVHELRTLSRHPKYKTELCRTFHSTGLCPYGPRCHFIHNSEDSTKCLMSNFQRSRNISSRSMSSGSISPPESLGDLDICGLSVGSAGDLSPTSSSSGSGSPTSSLCGFFPDDGYVPYQVPHTAPPKLTSSSFFDFLPPKTNQAFHGSPPSYDGYWSHLHEGSDDEPLSPPIGLESPESELNPLRSQLNPLRESHCDSVQKMEPSAAIDINQNNLRLPIFSRLSLGSPP